MLTLNDEYTCASCRRTFKKGWSDEEAESEAAEAFPGLDVHDPNEAAIVCDDCYNKMMGKVPQC